MATTSFPPSINGQTIKRWTVKSDANYPGSQYRRGRGHVAGRCEVRYPGVQ